MVENESALTKMPALLSHADFNSGGWFTLNRQSVCCSSSFSKLNPVKLKNTALQQASADNSKSCNTDSHYLTTSTGLFLLFGIKMFHRTSPIAMERVNSISLYPEM